MSLSPKDTVVAAYKQIEVSLRRKISEGHWPIGMMLPSRRDLAKEYGVSPITIERAINPLLSEGVLRADDRRGTFVARVLDESVSLTSGAPLVLSPPSADLAIVRAPSSAPRPEPATATIGIVASLYVFNRDHLELNNFWVRLLVQSLEQTFSENGHRTRFFNRVQEQGQPLMPLRDSLSAALLEGVDALALIGFGLAPQEVDESLAVLDEVDVPVVCITSGELRRPVPHVFFDNRSAGYDAAQCLLRIGCHDILYLAPFTASWVQERLEGIRTAVEYAGLDRNSLHVYPDHVKHWVQEEDPQVLGYEAASNFFAGGGVPSGVICANDGLSFGLLQAAAEYGLTAGRDFAIVSFDDHPDARARQLTTLRPPMEAMGQEASRLLLRALQGEQTGFQVRLRWHLIPRASSSVPIHPHSQP